MTPSPASSPRAGLPGLEMVPLAERLRAMHFLRLALAALVIVAYVALPGVAHGNLPILAAGTAGYLVFSITGYFLWRAGRGRGLILFSALLLLDGAFLAWATYASGGVGSPPAYLLFAYVVAVTLVAPYRTGLKVVLWESLLLLAAFQVRATGILPALGIHPPAPGSAEYRRVILLVVGLWLTGIVTASYSALNERELRRRRFDLTSLTDMADELEQDMRPAAIAGMLLRRTSETFDFTRGLVLARSDYGRLDVLAAEGTEPGLGPVPATDTVERAWATRAPVLVKLSGDEALRRVAASLGEPRPARSCRSPWARRSASRLDESFRAACGRGRRLSRVDMRRATALGGTPARGAYPGVPHAVPGGSPPDKHLRPAPADVTPGPLTLPGTSQRLCTPPARGSDRRDAGSSGC